MSSSDRDGTGRVRSQEIAWTVVALVPAGLVWAMVVAGSLHGLVAFGETALGWSNAWAYLVPGTLDGVSVTFAVLAFRSVRWRRPPARSYQGGWGAAAASSVVNFAYQYTRSHNAVAGGYVALLSILGVVMFHEFLSQSIYTRRSGDDLPYVGRSPRFAARWLTWPTHTLRCAVAWQNHPPPVGTPATVQAAIVNLQRVRSAKQDARRARVAGRHERALDRARRRSQLRATAAAGHVDHDADARPAAPPHPPAEALAPVAAGATPQDRTQAAQGIRRPETPATVAEWIIVWQAMCARGESIVGPLGEDDARSRYGVSARQARRIRTAALSGSLRRQAQKLGVELPDTFVDDPAHLGPTDPPPPAGT